MKKSFVVILSILFAFTAFFACQKEFSIEHGILPGQQAKGTLRDTSGNCLPDSVHGTWYNGVTPGDSNYVEIKVNVDTIGTYVIYTDTQNGLSFRDSGAFTSTGLNTVLLKPTGTATGPDTTLFTVYFDTSICQFSLPVHDSTGTGLGSTAEFTLKGSPDTCMTYNVYGKWSEGTALNPDSNVVTVDVDVTKLGKYSVSIAATNGISFADSGTFTSLGTQTIALHATGTPTVSGTNTFALTAGTNSTCSFDVFIINSVNASNTSWQFTEAANNYSGFTASAYVVDSSSFKVLYIYGFTPATFDTSFAAAILYSGTDPAVGDYSSKSGVSYFAFVRESTSDTLYKALPQDTNSDVKISVTAYDASSGVLDATFSGTAIAANGSIVNITNGRFKIKIDK